MSEKQTRKRERANYTEEEKRFFLQLVKKHRDIIEEKRTSAIFVKKKREAWNQITESYNMECTSGPRVLDQLKALYENMKQKAKKTYGDINKLEIDERNSTDDADIVLRNINDKVETESESLSNNMDHIKDNKNGILGSLRYSFDNGEDESEVTTNQSIPRLKVEVEAVPIRVQRYRNLSARTLERIYFKRKCQNACLERRKLLQQIYQNKQQHTLKMMILKRKLERLQSNNN